MSVVSISDVGCRKQFYSLWEEGEKSSSFSLGVAYIERIGLRETVFTGQFQYFNP